MYWAVLDRSKLLVLLICRPVRWRGANFPFILNLIRQLHVFGSINGEGSDADAA